MEEQMAGIAIPKAPDILQRIVRLQVLTIAWMTLEVIVALAAAWAARSPALLGSEATVLSNSSRRLSFFGGFAPDRIPPGRRGLQRASPEGCSSSSEGSSSSVVDYVFSDTLNHGQVSPGSFSCLLQPSGCPCWRGGSG